MRLIPEPPSGALDSMPRAHTEQEIAAIRLRLMEVGEELFTRIGLRKTTIDDLARAAGIGKGSFYNFFQSKEDLFLAIQETIEEKVSARVGTLLEKQRGDPRKMVRSFFEACLDTLENHPFLGQLADPELTRTLARTVPPERMARMQQQNHELYRKLFQSWIDEEIVVGVDADTLFGLLGALFVLHQRRANLGPRADQVLAWFLDSICALAPPA